ncbi:LacI family DNA-binding transcriptional regulator [Mammaliicoccus sciuri]|uniref:LacI family DNA-binding transcriptional regulator n=1 Tax=Mammaliicoccus sciuri TaxID=1296 RepID=UPI000D1E9630|nr:LacI family DNA-binding transcriptional regulator [Mammaliicoccus sciuri]MCD8895320.1 LacI family DNA-binding transcriptional regulator [Mammaliicoccus sciuri]MCD8913455.1 LacI family DNA-binding transcriptional regulator [Mammaliicoccus sciuri]PTK11271.1 LacI family transcriptional regulator [Mammaliicoccus sciuri]
MSRQRVSASQVAKLANVSQSTVSRVFTPGASVSEKARKKVMAVANELNYKPNALARGLIMNKTNLVGIAMKAVQNPFYHETLAIFTKKLKEIGYSVLFVNSENEEIQQEEINQFLEYNVEAIIVTDAILSSGLVDKLSKAQIPVILFNRRDESSNSYSVTCDNINAATNIADYFYQRGHKHNVFISGLLNTSTNQERLTGFKRYFDEKNMEVDVIHGDYTYEKAYHLTYEFLKSGKKIDALFGANDVTALGALDAIKAYGLSVPEDVEVIGFDDIKMASWPNNNLSTWSQPIEEMVDGVINILTDPSSVVERDQYVQGKLVRRKTTVET